VSSPIEQLRYLVACRCGSEYTDRGLHEPNSIHEYSEDVEAVAAALTSVITHFEGPNNSGLQQLSLANARVVMSSASALPPAEPVLEPPLAERANPHCKCDSADAIHWNPYNKVTQCHRCGGKPPPAAPAHGDYDPDITAMASVYLPPAEPAPVPWAAGPGQARCGVMYSGEHWAPRPCVKPNSHAFHADEYGRTWTAEPAPDRHCQHARDPATCKLCAGIAQRQRFDPDEVPAIRTAESVDLFNRAVALTVLLLDESQSDAERDDALVERCNIRDELKRRDELWRSDG